MSMMRFYMKVVRLRTSGMVLSSPSMKVKP